MVVTMIWLLLATSALAAPAPSQKKKAHRELSSKDYFKRWLKTDVKYIITDEERGVFDKLTTVEERNAFIEQFWFRRDPNPDTKRNEYKEEHYRRIAYANERFQSGKPGWMTDRGRVYIIHGEPASIERHPSGGSYQRPIAEGGTRTFTFPFEIWYYRNIPGMEGEVELEFVDNSFSGEYHLALRPEEKDMLLYVPGTAPTLFELLGQDSGRKDRAFFNPGLENNAAWQTRHGYSSKDTPFARYTKFAMVTKATKIKFPDLRKLINTRVLYNTLPFGVRSDIIPLSSKSALVPITVQIKNEDLTFKLRNGVYGAKVNLYGTVKNMVGRVVTEFEDTMLAEYRPEVYARGRTIKSIYQKVSVLDTGRRYSLDIVVEDQNSDRRGFTKTAIVVPKSEDQDQLDTSSLILSKVIGKAPSNVGPNERFIIGNIKILPNVGNNFYPGESVGAYLQVYNFASDQTTRLPSLLIRYRVRQGKKVLVEFEESDGESIQYSSPRRLVLIRQIPLLDLAVGEYQIQLELEDQISQKKVTREETFQIVPEPTGTR